MYVDSLPSRSTRIFHPLASFWSSSDNTCFFLELASLGCILDDIALVTGVNHAKDEAGLPVRHVARAVDSFALKHSFELEIFDLALHLLRANVEYHHVAFVLLFRELIFASQDQHLNSTDRHHDWIDSPKCLSSHTDESVVNDLPERLLVSRAIELYVSY